MNLEYSLRVRGQVAGLTLMADLIPILVVLGIVFVIITLIGHAIWLTLAWIFRAFSGTERPHSTPSIITAPTEPKPHACPNCGYGLTLQLKYCGVCGARRPTPA